MPDREQDQECVLAVKIREGYYPEQIRNQSLKDTMPELGQLQQEVYDVIKSSGEITTQRIAEVTGRYVHSITGRVFELRDLGYVEFAGSVKSPATGRKVSLWKVTNKQLTLF